MDSSLGGNIYYGDKGVTDSSKSTPSDANDEAVLSRMARELDLSSLHARRLLEAVGLCLHTASRPVFWPGLGLFERQQRWVRFYPSA